MSQNAPPRTISLAIASMIAFSYIAYALKCELKGLVNGRVQCLLHDHGRGLSSADEATERTTSHTAEDLIKSRRKTPASATKTRNSNKGLDLEEPYSKFRVQDFKSHVVKVIPYTRWCGEIFDSADLSYQDLVLFTKTEKCCKQHDDCQLSLKPREDKNGLLNSGLLPRYHCCCENDFRSCLRRVNSPAGNKIGFTYFNVFGPQCFREDYPIVECSTNKSERCLVYKLNRTLKKTYQWFDVPQY